MKRTQLRRKTPLRRVSDKQRARNALYKVALAQWRAQHDGRCEMRLQINGRPAPRIGIAFDQCHERAMAAPHHRKGRSGTFLCDTSTYSGLCAAHHHWIHHESPNLARALGWLEF